MHIYEVCQSLSKYFHTRYKMTKWFKENENKACVISCAINEEMSEKTTNRNSRGMHSRTLSGISSIQGDIGMHTGGATGGAQQAARLCPVPILFRISKNMHRPYCVSVTFTLEIQRGF